MDDRDEWLEGVMRWYFGGTPGPYDEIAGVDASPADLPQRDSHTENYARALGLPVSELLRSRAAHRSMAANAGC